MGAKDIWTNGYCFQFNHNGSHYSLVNQTDRIIVTVHKENLTEEESAALEEIVWLEHDNKELYDDWCTKLQYRVFDIEDTASIAIRKLIN